MADEPVCLCQWFHVRAPDAAVRMATRALEGIPIERRADMVLLNVASRTEFMAGIQDWYAHSTNTQYLILVTHGVEDADTGEWTGVGSSPRDEPLGPDDSITWQEFWNLVVRPKQKPPALLLVGCMTVEAVKVLRSPLLTHRANNPYLVVLSEEVTPEAMRRVYRLVERLLQNINDWSMSLERELENIRNDFPTAHLCYPVVAIEGSPAQYVDAERMPEVIGMTFREYLDLANDWHRQQADIRRSRRRGGR